MSLTSFLSIRDVKKKFLEEFPKRRLSLKKQLIAPPLTNRYSLVGTAFDYLLRFYVENFNPKTLSVNCWVAHKSLELIKNNKSLGFSSFVYDIDKESLTENKSLYQKAAKMVSKAEKDYSLFKKTGRINNSLIKSTLFLAQLDSIFRAGYIDENMGVIDQNDIKDLKKLITIVDKEIFKAKKICLLNPTFGKASKMVGGADSDLIVDDMIIDIKTTKNLRLERDYFNQLLGYYILYKIGRIDGLPSRNEIKKLGIYFSRYAYLHVFEVKEIINEKTFPEFLTWFVKKAEQMGFSKLK